MTTAVLGSCVFDGVYLRGSSSLEPGPLTPMAAPGEFKVFVYALSTVGWNSAPPVILAYRGRGDSRLARGHLPTSPVVVRGAIG